MASCAGGLRDAKPIIAGRIRRFRDSADVERARSVSVVICAEAGINHQGDLDIAKQLIEKAAWAGADYVKFQKREPELAVPKDQWDIKRQTPWGEMSYIDYKRKMEFDFEQLNELRRHAKQCDIEMFLSVWDMPSLEVARDFAFDMVKLPSAMLTNEELVRAAVQLAMSQPCDLVLSTGMSTAAEVAQALVWVSEAWEFWTLKQFKFPETKPNKLWLLHCHSAYPAPTSELNLNLIPGLMVDAPDLCSPAPVCIGYSGHEWGIQPTVWSVAMGAQMIERHITLDRTMWGTDQMASVEPLAFAKMVNYIRSLEEAMGDGEKRVWDSEISARDKLRGTA